MKVFRHIMGSLLLAAFPVWSQEKDPFEVHDWAILVVDAQNGANAAVHFKSSLPPFIATRREKAGAKDEMKPMPHGMIAFYGEPEEAVEAVLNIEKAGRFYSHWPPARARSKRLSWLDLQTSAERDKSSGVLERLDEKHWLAPGRTGKARYIVQREKQERFLFYDAKLSYTFPVEVTGGGPEPVEVTIKDKKKVAYFALYRPEENGWKAGGVANLAADNKSFVFESMQTADKTAILKQWGGRLAKAGLFEPEVELILSVLREHGLSGEEMTAICRLDAEAMEGLLPLEIYPYPEKSVRVGLVLMKGFDPARMIKLDHLIARLGAPVWKERETAFDSLEKMGKQILPKLKDSMKSDDPEIVYRIERLLHLIDPPAPPK